MIPVSNPNLPANHQDAGDITTYEEPESRYGRSDLIKVRCCKCEIGIGTSQVYNQIKKKYEIFYHTQKKPRVNEGKNYCDSCYKRYIKNGKN